ncbi:MAG: component of SufBCD complex [Paracoccaceae bacterium]|nr:component of SufBCD complex [Paracoccaceae bacterium]
MAAFDGVDIRSFSNLWFWIVLAVMWSSASHWVIGIPYDLIQRARRNGGQAERDLEVLMAINARRFVVLQSRSGLWLVGLSCAMLSSLAWLGFGYRIELAQAVFLLSFPISLVALMSLKTASQVRAEATLSEALYRRFRHHRTVTQGIGVTSIFITATWGIYHNLSQLILGGVP